MTVRGTLTLLGLFAVLATYLLLVPPPPAPHPSPGTPLLSVPADRVTSLAIVWADRRLRATRVGDGWRSDAGASFPADMIEDLLATLSTLRPTETLADGESAADYGLAPPGASLVISEGDTRLLQLDVGGRNPAWTGVYVRRTGGAGVELVGALLDWELGKLRETASH